MIKIPAAAAGIGKALEKFIGLLGDKGKMKQLGQTADQVSGLFERMSGTNITEVINRIIEFLGTPFMASAEIIMGKVMEELVPIMMPILDKITSGELDPFFEKIADLIVRISEVGYDVIIRAVQQVMDFVEQHGDKLSNMADRFVDIFDQYGEMLIDLLMLSMEFLEKNSDTIFAMLEDIIEFVEFLMPLVEGLSDIGGGLLGLLTGGGMGALFDLFKGIGNLWESFWESTGLF